MKSAIIKILGLMSLVFVTACGSSTSTGTDLSTEQDQQTGVIVSQMVGGLSRSSSLSLPPTSGNVVQKDLTISCNGGGTITVDTETIIYDDCIVSYDDTRITSDGSLTIDTSTDTITWDLTVTTETISTGASETTAMAGTLTTSGGTTTASMSGTVDGTSWSISGTLTLASSILDGTVDITLGSASIQCIFTSFDTSTATPDDYSANCSVI